MSYSLTYSSHSLANSSDPLEHPCKLHLATEIISSQILQLASAILHISAALFCHCCIQRTLFSRLCHIRLSLQLSSSSVMKRSTDCNTLPQVSSSPHGNYIDSNLPALPYCFITLQDSKVFSNTGSTFYLAPFKLIQNATVKADNGFH